MDNEIDSLPIMFWLLLVALVAPLVLMPLSKSLPYPYIIEELVKVGLIFFVLKLPTKILQLKIALLAGFLFALSENIFYLTNFITNGTLASFWQRSLLSIALHILTITIILLPSQKNRVLIIPATLLAMFVHFFFNQIVISIFK